MPGTQAATSSELIDRTHAFEGDSGTAPAPVPELLQAYISEKKLTLSQTEKNTLAGELRAHSQRVTRVVCYHMYGSVFDTAVSRREVEKAICECDDHMGTILLTKYAAVLIQNANTWYEKQSGFVSSSIDSAKAKGVKGMMDWMAAHPEKWFDALFKVLA
ncbi:MAG TPA: hypothetical protein VK633_13005 [Verrucomicrobiae bacterium]|nr:hypothetical protein [Verrucomicrobiae bacterium]